MRKELKQMSSPIGLKKIELLNKGNKIVKTEKNISKGILSKIYMFFCNLIYKSTYKLIDKMRSDARRNSINELRTKLSNSFMKGRIDGKSVIFESLENEAEEIDKHIIFPADDITKEPLPLYCRYKQDNYPLKNDGSIKDIENQYKELNQRIEALLLKDDLTVGETRELNRLVSFQKVVVLN